MISGTYRPLTVSTLIDRLADLLAASTGTQRIAVDGPPVADPAALATALVAPLLARGRPAVHLRADAFWRDASLRLEHGRRDVLSYPDWLDEDALRREVLDPVVGTGRYLPSLRDPANNRSTRAAPQRAGAGTILLVSGSLLLGRALPFERTVHLALSPAARARRTPAADAWMLPAYDAYDREVDPVATADVVIRADDPHRPAVAGL